MNASTNHAPATNAMPPSTAVRIVGTTAAPRDVQHGREPGAILREHQQHDEQHDDRQRVVDALHPHRHVLHLAETPVEVAEGQPENHRAQRREREAAQAADDGDGVRADHEQGQAGDVEREDGREQDAGQRREHAPDDPARGRRDIGILAVEAREVAVVDDGPHRDADAGAREQRPQAERDARRDREHDEVVPRDRRARERHHVALDRTAGATASPRTCSAPTRPNRCRAASPAGRW